MNLLYIGQYTPGTTSKMRADQLNKILQPDIFGVIDTHIPFHQTPRLWRSLGFRYKRGPLVNKANQFVLDELAKIKTPQFDLIWVDKAIFLTAQTTNQLKSLTTRLVHFTPDMAFFGNYSSLFEKSLSSYDYLITTKTAEKSHYLQKVAQEKLIITTQGFDKQLHRPIVPFSEKEDIIAFIGLCEPSREQLVQQLINHEINIKVAGKGWNSFIDRNRNNPFLSFKGEGLFSEQYTSFIASARFSIGMLSKRFPELHTTRTFEIPACGAALITERNEETSAFFDDEEAIFYDTPEEMIEKIRYYQEHPQELEQLTQKGTERVHRDGRDYESILEKILKSIKVL